MAEFEDDTWLRRCQITAREDQCTNHASDFAPVAICDVHADEVTKWFGNRNHVAAIRSRLMREQSTPQAIELRGQGIPRACVVYYVRVGEYIKIGTSVDYKRRLAAYPPDSVLLATEPGSYDLETRRHREFAQYLQRGNEWFEPGPRLMAHIQKLAKAA